MRTRTASVVTFAAVLALIGAGAVGASAAGANRTWDFGGAADTNWQTAANWNGDTDIDPDDLLFFPVGGATNNDYPDGFVVRSMQFDGGFDVSGNDISLNAGIVANQSASMTLDIAVAASQTWNVADLRNLQMSGTTTIAAGQELVLAGDGQMTFNGAVNGADAVAQLRADGVETLVLIGGGDVQTLQVGGDTIVVSSGVYPALDVHLDSGVLIGGQPGNLGNLQRISDVIVGTDSVLAPGYDITGGADLGQMYITNTTRGTDTGRFVVGVLDGGADILVTGSFQPDDMALVLNAVNPGPAGSQFVIVKGDTVANSFLTTDGVTQLLDGDHFLDTLGQRWRINYLETSVVITLDPVVLPATGVESGILAGSAMLVAVAGIVLVLVRRRAISE